MITFTLFAMDKRRAVRHEWRIPEARLMLFSLIGGSLGGLLAMVIVKHKTRHPKFIIGMPAILILNIFIFYYLMTIFR